MWPLPRFCDPNVFFRLFQFRRMFLPGVKPRVTNLNKLYKSVTCRSSPDYLEPLRHRLGS